MKKTMLISHREYMENVRTKTFWIGIFFFPVILILAILVPILLEKAKDARRYAVIDQSGWLAMEVQQRVDSPDLAKVIRKGLEDYKKKIEGLPNPVKKLFVDIEKIDEQFKKFENKLDEIAEYFAIAVGDEPPFPTLKIPKIPTVPSGKNTLTDSDDQPDDENSSEEDNPLGVTEEFMHLLKQGREQIRQWWKNLPPEEAKKYAKDLSRARYVRIDVDPSWTDPEGKLNAMLDRETLFAFFVINEDPVTGGEGCKYVSNNLTDDSLQRWYSRHATTVVRGRRLAHEGLDKEVADWIDQDLRFASKKISEEGQQEEVRAQDKVSQFAPIAFVYLLWISVFAISQMLLTNTIEEKSSRIIEVLLSSVSPLELMAGKIFGLAATGLTVVATWIIFFFTIVKCLPLFVDKAPDIDFAAIISSPAYLAPFIMYFLLGYLFFAAFYVGIGSVCNTLKEAQNLIVPVVIVLIIPLLAMVPIAQDPNGTLAKFLSYIPPFTPFVMMNRAAAPPTMFEYVVTTSMLVVSIILAFLGAARIFRVGILMTGKPPRPLEIIRMLFSRG